MYAKQINSLFVCGVNRGHLIIFIWLHFVLSTHTSIISTHDTQTNQQINTYSQYSTCLRPVRAKHCGFARSDGIKTQKTSFEES